MVSAPAISVLLPLQDDRDAGLECIHAWLSQQLPRDRYELIFLAPGRQPDLERVARPLATENDVWIEHRGAGEWELFNVGAEAARGRYVFITEAHCVAEPDCLAAMLSHLERSGRPGACGSSIGEGQSALGELERAVYEEDFRIGQDPEHWNKVLIHSLAIRRDVYLDAGGFDLELGEFAGWALAIELWERGHRLDYTPAPRVRHRYTGDLSELSDHIRDFARGEMRYLASQPHDVWRRYLVPPREWSERGALTRAGARRLPKAALLGGRPYAGTLRSTARHAPTAVGGAAGAVSVARANAMFHRARVLALRGERRVRAYRDFWAACAHWGRLEWLAANDPASTPEATVGCAFDPSCDVPAGTAGVHGPERWRERPFRWTEALATIPLSAPPGPRAGSSFFRSARPRSSRERESRRRSGGAARAAQRLPYAIRRSRWRAALDWARMSADASRATRSGRTSRAGASARGVGADTPA